MVCFKAVIQFYHKWVIELCANILFIFYDIFLLIFADKLFEHHLHSIELSISQATHKIYLAESSNRQALQHLILLQSAFSHELKTVKTEFFCFQSALADGDTIIE